MANIEKDLAKLISSFKETAKRPEQRGRFVNEMVAICKEKQKLNSREAESLIDLLFEAVKQMTNQREAGAIDVPAALTALEVLLELKLTGERLLRCNNYVRWCLIASDASSTNQAAHAFGLCLQQPNVPRDVVFQVVKDAVGWLSDSRADAFTRKLTAAVVVKEAAQHMPVALFPHITEFFENIWIPLSDGVRGDLRARALETFKEAMRLLVNRPHQVQADTFAMLFKKLKAHLESRSVDQVIAAELVFESIVLNSMNVTENHYDELWEKMWALRAHSAQYVRQLAVSNTTVLIKYNTASFTRLHIGTVVQFALDQVRKDTERNGAFILLRDVIAEVSQAAFEKYLDMTILAIKQCFIQQKKAEKLPVWEALACLATICKRSPSQGVEAHVQSCIEHVFGWGLSTDLISHLRAIVRSCSMQTQLKLQEHLLDMISITLSGLQFRQRSGQSSSVLAALTNASNAGLDGPNSAQTLVALNALVEFDFTNSELLGDFIRDSILPFLDSHETEIRLAAINTISRLLFPAEGSLSVARSIIIDQVIARFLTVANADMSPQIRVAILSAMTDRFHPYLAQLHFMRYIFSACGDECVDVRAKAVGLLCRLLAYNPSHTLPALRKYVVALISRVNLTERAESAVEADIAILTIIATEAPSVAATFTLNLCEAIHALVERLPSAETWCGALLDCLAAFARSSGLAFGTNGFATFTVGKICDLFGALNLPDKRSAEWRTAAMRALACILESCGIVVTPYEQHPHLYKIIHSAIRNPEEPAEMRAEALRVIGIIGAIDPHKMKSESFMQEIEGGGGTTAASAQESASDAVNPARVVMRALASLLSPTDGTVAATNDTLIRSVVSTLTTISDRCSDAKGELHCVLPAMVDIAKKMMPGRLRNFVLLQISRVVTRSGPKAIQYISSLTNLIDATLGTEEELFAIRICTALCPVARTEFGRYLPHLLPKLFLIFDGLAAPEECLIDAVLEFFLRADTILQPFIILIARVITTLLEKESVSDQLCAHVVATLSQLGRTLSLQEVGGTLIRAVLSRLDTFGAKSPTFGKQHAFVSQSINFFTTMLVQLQTDAIKFIPCINRGLETHRLTAMKYSYLALQINMGKAVTMADIKNVKEEASEVVREVRSTIERAIDQRIELVGVDSHVEDTQETAAVNCNSPTVDLPIAESVIFDHAKASDRFRDNASKDDWVRWFQSLTLDVLQQSPNAVFRCCSVRIPPPSLAELAPSFVSEIFNVAFRVFWHGASTALRRCLVECFANVLPNEVPDDILLTVLSLAEYMDATGSPLPIEPGRLSAVAESKGILAKALHWKEAEYYHHPASCVRDLISLYSKVNNTESAVGMLNSLSTSDGLDRTSLMQSSLVKLGRYAEALDVMERNSHGGAVPSISGSVVTPKKEARSTMIHRRTRSVSVNSEGDSFSHITDPAVARQLEMKLSKVTCLSEIGDVYRVLAEWRSIFHSQSLKSPVMRGGDPDDEDSLLGFIAPYAVEAAIQLRAWDNVADAVDWIPQTNLHHFIGKAALRINERRWEDALSVIGTGRRLLVEDVSALIGESYERAYDSILAAQQLTELEETIGVLSIADREQQLVRRGVVTAMWRDRIGSMATSLRHWKRVLTIRGLLFGAREDVGTRIAFVKLCREAQQSKLELFALEELLGSRSPSRESILDPEQNPKVVFEYITYLSNSNHLHHDGLFGSERSLLTQLIALHDKKPTMKPLLARFYARQAQLESGRHSVHLYAQATEADPTWFFAWHSWAAANEAQHKAKHDDALGVSAITGYIKSINLGPTTASIFQDILKLLSLWAQFADNRRVLVELKRQFAAVPLSAWLLVVPQLIARMDYGSDYSCELVGEMLIRIASSHPQLLIYPLIVCTAAAAAGRRHQSARKVLSKMRELHPDLVAQGSMVSTELIRLSSVVHERWYNGLEAAAKDFFWRRDYDAFCATMLPLHEAIRKIPETLMEVEFHQRFGRSLAEAREWIKSYISTKNVADLHTVWALYQPVHGALSVFLQHAFSLDLQYCSAKLFEANNMAITVPDTRPREGAEAIRIASFSPAVRVMKSKQRPKKIAIIGTDGVEYRFLLKGGEDLRLDERVMQLFKLANVVLASHSNSNRVAGYQIQRYSVIPLWNNVGLIGWVDGCDTLEELVSAYRTARKIPDRLEFSLMLHVLPEVGPRHGIEATHEKLEVIQKEEVMLYVADHTTGHDIRKAMWTSSGNSEAWLDRRTTYTRSLAVMSMVGYILGLGDRHPQNIMIQRHTGKVVHIDFGDCFEVTMTRDKFPEKVPFRLTRMLRNAMEVCGVEGHYRSAAEIVMGALRESRSSVLAMLEAFAYDPLISMRLVNKKEEGQGAGQHSEKKEKTDEPQSPDTFLSETMGAFTRAASEFMSVRADNNNSIAGFLKTMKPADEHDDAGEVISPEAVRVLRRLELKLRGNEFDTAAKLGDFSGPGSPLQSSMPAKDQVARLIQEATSVTNLSQHYVGWFPFW